MAHTVARKLISSKVDLMSTKHGFMPASVLPIPMAVRNISKPASLPFQMDYRSCLTGLTNITALTSAWNLPASIGLGDWHLLSV